MNSPTDNKNFNVFLDEYRAFILKTWSSPNLEFLHASWGFIGEVLEYDTNDSPRIDEYLKEQYLELGDLYYYLFTLERITQVKIDWEWDGNMADKDITQSAQRLSNIIKKHIWYKHELQDLNLNSIYYTIQSELAILNAANPKTKELHSPRSIMEMNMEKLRKRYPDGHFTSEHAELRLDTKE